MSMNVAALKPVTAEAAGLPAPVSMWGCTPMTVDTEAVEYVLAGRSAASGVRPASAAPLVPLKASEMMRAAPAWGSDGERTRRGESEDGGVEGSFHE
jgi:hypothetical protein